MDHLDLATKILTLAGLVVTLAGGIAIRFRDRIQRFVRQRRNPGAVFLQHSNHNANARPYIGFIVGAIPERHKPLDSRDIDVIRAWVAAVRPDAKALSSSGAGITYVVHPSDNSPPIWIAQIHAGGVLAVHTVVGLRRYGEEGALGDYGISVPDVVEWWEGMIEAMPALLRGLGLGKVVAGFTVQTIPTDPPFVTYLAFDVANQGVQLGQASSVSPWGATINNLRRRRLSPTLVHKLVPDLARHFGVWHVDESVKFLQESFRRRHSPGEVVYVRSPESGLPPWRRMSRIYLGPIPGGAQYQVLDETTYRRWTADVYVPGGAGDRRESGWVVSINGQIQARNDGQPLAFESQDDAFASLMTYAQRQFTHSVQPS
jgi:hypothetical protein